MKSFMEQAKEELNGVMFCAYCMEAKGNKLSCCEEVHFLEFQDFDDDTQTQIIQDEYDATFGK